MNPDVMETEESREREMVEQMKKQFSKNLPSRRVSLRGRKRVLAAFCVVLSVTLASAGLSVAPVSAQSTEGPVARVWVRKLASENVEFGVAVYAAGSSNPTYVTVNNRYFPYADAASRIGSWYNSEPIILSNGDDKTLAAIRARRLASGNLEFALRIHGSNNQIWIPRARYFVHSSAVTNNVLYSSPLYLRQHDRACLDGAVADPTDTVGLFGDCETLLIVKDKFFGSAADRARRAPTVATSWSGTNPLIPVTETRTDDEGNAITVVIGSSWGTNTISTHYVMLKDDRVSELSIGGIRGGFSGGGYSTHGRTGKIPKELERLDQLELLRIHGANGTVSEIPPELGNLSNLKSLELQTPYLTGEIPPELGNLSNLQKLEIHGYGTRFGNTREENIFGSDLSGSIPSELENLSNLIELNLRYNRLTGPIPPELGNLTNLERLNLYTNTLSGQIPPELGSLSNLKTLILPSTGFDSIGGNKFTGSLPSRLGNLTNLEEVNLSGHSLGGSIPSEWGSLNNWIHLYLNDNKLSGRIPAFGVTSTTDPVTGEVSTTGPAQMTHLYLSNNNLDGEIPASLGTLKKLEYLSLDRNSLRGQIPTQLEGLAPNLPANPGSLLILQLHAGTDAASDDNPGLITSTSCVPRRFLTSTASVVKDDDLPYCTS